MRRIGGENRRNPRSECRHARRATLRAITLGLALSTTVRALDEGPELLPPIDLPAQAPTPSPPRSVVSTPSARGPVLALPGITTPPARRPIESSDLAPPVESALPALDAPIEMRNAPPAARSMQPPLMESFPIERGTIVEVTPSRVQPNPRRDPSPAPASSAAKPAAPASRRPWYLGGPRTANAPASPPSSRSEASVKGPVGSKTDPATEAALKRKIERQARVAIGDRARAIEVRVVGQQVAIEARGVRFIQKRGVRKTLEGLPALSGLRSSVSVQD